MHRGKIKDGNGSTSQMSTSSKTIFLKEGLFPDQLRAGKFFALLSFIQLKSKAVFLFST